MQTSAIVKTDATVSHVCTHLRPPTYSNVSLCHAFLFLPSVISINEWMDGWTDEDAHRRDAPSLSQSQAAARPLVMNKALDLLAPWFFGTGNLGIGVIGLGQR
jgi:hypothetical protein